MSKRQFDHIENKIREAAENSEPAFDEQAWDKMEAKLNAEKERKWSPFLWLSVALLSAGLLGRFIVYHNQSSLKTGATQNVGVIINSDKNIHQQASTVNNNVVNTIANKESLSPAQHAEVSGAKNNDQQINQLADEKNSNSSDISSSNSNNVTNLSAEKLSNSIEKNKSNIIRSDNRSVISKSDRTDKKYNSIEANILAKKAVSKNIYGKNSSKKKNRKRNMIFVESDNHQLAYSSSQKNERIIRGKTRAKIKAAAQVEAATDTMNVNNETTTSSINNNKSIAFTDKDKKKDSVKKIILTDTTAIIESSKKEVKKENILPKKKSWYLLASIGPDASNVKLLSFKNSVITPRYGAGIGYQINKRFSIQTGFYAGRKKYVAGANDYSDAKDPYLSSMNINKVEANCLIFDIPVTVRYNFILRPKTTFFATAGISSFIMKKEDYDYYYTSYNNNYEWSHSYTGNKNLFSIAAISIGIERKISRSFSIQAEPSVNIPIAAGVGEGTVKLFSTDIQLGVKYNFRW
jgi:hypothetical protein